MSKKEDKKNLSEEELSGYVHIGVVGYSGQKFDEEKAEEIIKSAFDLLEMTANDTVASVGFIIVSGLTNQGIPALAYQEADRRQWYTEGIACKKANDYELYDVDNVIIVGEEWGDESKTFLDKCDYIIRVGGGEQSHRECEEAQKRIGKERIIVLEFELDAS